MSLLGRCEVSVGSRLIRKDGWRLGKAASVVKLLALAPDHSLHRDQVMNLLWPNLGARDGVGGNDTVDGGAGSNDTCQKDTGDTARNCP